MTVLRWILIVVSVGYVGALAVLFFKQRSMLFPVPTIARVVPAAAGLPEAEEHVLTTADGVRVIVWHIPAKPGRAVILYFPGNGDFLAGGANRFKAMTADGTGLVVLSYRGYAGSSGYPSEAGLLQDAAAQSIGKLILEAPYMSTVDIAGALPLLRLVPVRLLMRDQFRSDQRIPRVTAPLLIMHGDRDAVIPIAAGEHLFALAHQPKQFIRFAGGGHDDLDEFGAMQAARQFINAAKG